MAERKAMDSWKVKPKGKSSAKPGEPRSGGAKCNPTEKPADYAGNWPPTTPAEVILWCIWLRDHHCGMTPAQKEMARTHQLPTKGVVFHKLPPAE